MDNIEFLKMIFGEDWETAHVTSFDDDPTNIPQNRRGICWGGHHALARPFSELNQYFTISRFNELDGRAVRQKAQFIAMYAVVADDVREKLPLSLVKILPRPTYKLLTSENSEQWGWVLSIPCTDITQANNLLDGLVKYGLSPDGKDPGMRGVTRYVRLPDGHNSKRNRLVNGQPFKCKLLEFNPEQRVRLEDLANPFGIDLNQSRGNYKINTSANVDHPVLSMMQVKQINSPGKYDITCPWVDDHTDQSNDGAMVFTNKDLSFGFECHHGGCQDKNKMDLLEWIDEKHPGESRRIAKWVMFRPPVSRKIQMFGVLPGMKEPLTKEQMFGVLPVVREPLTKEQMFGVLPVVEEPLTKKKMSGIPPTSEDKSEIDTLISAMLSQPLSDDFTLVYEIMQLTDKLPEESKKINIWAHIRDYAGWTKQEFKKILKERRRAWNNKRLPKKLIPKFSFPDVREFSESLKASVDNLIHLLKEYNITAEFNVINKTEEVIVPGIAPDSDGYEHNALETVTSLAIQNDMPYGKIASQLTKICYDNPINPVVDYLTNLNVVGSGHITRLANYLIVDSDKNDIKNEIFRKFMIAACAAADHASCTSNPEAKKKFENVMVLVGAQGASKTKFFREILPKKLQKFFKEGQFLDPSDKDSVIDNFQCWISELGEVDGTFRRTDIARLKAYLSKPVDNLRLPFAPKISSFKRTTVFVGSVNDEEFLKDHTGNRRYWPIKVKRANLPTDATVIDSAWAETWTAYVNGEQWWPSDELEQRLEKHRQTFLLPVTKDGIDEFLMSTITDKKGCFSLDLFKGTDIVETLDKLLVFESSIKETPNIQTISRIINKFNLLSSRKLNNGRIWFRHDKADSFNGYKQQDLKLAYENQKDSS